jgi:hypothetical protein
MRPRTARKSRPHCGHRKLSIATLIALFAVVGGAQLLSPGSAAAADDVGSDARWVCTKVGPGEYRIPATGELCAVIPVSGGSTPASGGTTTTPPPTCFMFPAHCKSWQAGRPPSRSGADNNRGSKLGSGSKPSGISVPVTPIGVALKGEKRRKAIAACNRIENSWLKEKAEARAGKITPIALDVLFNDFLFKWGVLSCTGYFTS